MSMNPLLSMPIPRGQQDDQMAMAGVGAQPPRMAANATNPAPARQGSPLQMPTVTPGAMQVQPKADNPNPLAGAFASFARGFAPQQTQAVDARHKADAAERMNRALAWMQQTAAQPAEQRAAFTLQSAQDIARDTGQSYEAVVASARDPNAFSDQVLNSAIAKFQGQLGIAPEKPEPMNAYQAAQIELEKEKAGRPTPYSLGDGAFAEYDPTADAGKRLNMIRQPTEQPVKYEQFTDASGQVWDVNPYTRERIKADGMRARVPGEGGGDGAQYRWASPEEIAAAGLPDGTSAQINTKTGETVIKGRPSTAQTGQPTESERSAGMHAQISLSGLDKIIGMETSGYNRAGWDEQRSMGFGEKERMYDQAAAEFIDGYLRAMTGAAATKNEIDTYKSQWFPQFGDTAPVIAQKAQGRLNAINAMKSKAGRSWQPEWDASVSRMSQMLEPKRDGFWGKTATNMQRMGGAQPSPAVKPLAAPQGGVPPEAVQELMSDPSPEAMAEFDDAFGPGAAEAALNGSR